MGDAFLEGRCGVNRQVTSNGSVAGTTWCSAGANTGRRWVSWGFSKTRDNTISSRVVIIDTRMTSEGGTFIIGDTKRRARAEIVIEFLTKNFTALIVVASGVTSSSARGKSLNSAPSD